MESVIDATIYVVTLVLFITIILHSNYLGYKKGFKTGLTKGYTKKIERLLKIKKEQEEYITELLKENKELHK